MGIRDGGRMSVWAAEALRSIAAAAAAADAAPAGGGLTRKEGVFRKRAIQPVAIRAHGVVGQRGAFPGLHPNKIRMRAAGKNQGTKNEDGS